MKITPSKRSTLRTNLNVLRCFPRLVFFICSLACLFRRIYRPLVRCCIAFNWIFVGVCAQTFHYMMWIEQQLTSWLGVFNVNAYAKGWCCVTGICRIHFHWSGWKIKRAMDFGVFVVAAMVFPVQWLGWISVTVVLWTGELRRCAHSACTCTPIFT